VVVCTEQEKLTRTGLACRCRVALLSQLIEEYFEEVQ
jgi:hypothetical protein